MPTQVYLNSQAYCCVISFFSFVGMVFNSIFLWISTENSERRNLTDSTMISASITMIIKGFSLFINGFLAKSGGSNTVYGQLQIGLGKYSKLKDFIVGKNKVFKRLTIFIINKIDHE